MGVCDGDGHGHGWPVDSQPGNQATRQPGRPGSPAAPLNAQITTSGQPGNLGAVGVAGLAWKQGGSQPTPTKTKQATGNYAYSGISVARLSAPCWRDWPVVCLASMCPGPPIERYSLVAFDWLVCPVGPDYEQCPVAPEWRVCPFASLGGGPGPCRHNLNGALARLLPVARLWPDGVPLNCLVARLARQRPSGAFPGCPASMDKSACGPGGLRRGGVAQRPMEPRRLDSWIPCLLGSSTLGRLSPLTH